MNDCLEVTQEKKLCGHWTSLLNTFATKSLGTQSLVQKQLSRLKMKKDSSMREHLMAFEDLIRQLRVAGAKAVGCEYGGITVRNAS